MNVKLGIVNFLKDIKFLFQRTYHKITYKEKNIFKIFDKKVSIDNNFYPACYSTIVNLEKVFINKKIRDNRLKFELLSKVSEDFNKLNINLDNFDLLNYTVNFNNNDFLVDVTYDSFDMSYYIENKEELFVKHLITLTVSNDVGAISLSTVLILNDKQEAGTSITSVNFNPYNISIDNKKFRKFFENK